MREATRGLTLREIIEHMLEASGLVDFYKTDREGKERLENLEELVNAAEAFVTQEGFGKDAVALPVDEIARGAGGIFAAGRRAEFNAPARGASRRVAERVESTGEAGRAEGSPPSSADGAGAGIRRACARRRDRRDHVAAGRVPDPCLARSRRQPGAGRAGRDPADDDPLGERARVRLRLHHRPRGGPVPARELDRATSTASRRSGA